MVGRAGLSGLELDAERNRADTPVISTEMRRTTMRVISTDEERMIATRPVSIPFQAMVRSSLPKR